MADLTTELPQITKKTSATYLIQGNSSLTMSCVVIAPSHSQISDLAFLWEYYWMFTFVTES